jgi:hypothetical protein
LTTDKKKEAARLAAVVSGENPLTVSSSVMTTDKKASHDAEFRPWIRSADTKDVRVVAVGLPYPIRKNVNKLYPGHISIYEEKGNIVFVVKEAPGQESGVDVLGSERVIPSTLLVRFLKTERCHAFAKLLTTFLPPEESKVRGFFVMKTIRRPGCRRNFSTARNTCRHSRRPRSHRRRAGLAKKENATTVRSTNRERQSRRKRPKVRRTLHSSWVF